MSNIKLLILFNIIIIFLSYYFKKYIIIVYPFVFIFLISTYLKLHYKNNIEGNILYDDTFGEIQSIWEKQGEKTYDESSNFLLDKINKLLKVLIDVEEKVEEEYYDEKCEGEFIVDETDKKCGYNVYDEKTYKITKKGYDCDHRAGYKERDFKSLCKLDEMCSDDRDCDKGKCINSRCKIDFECLPDKLNNCDEEGCDALNDNVGYDKYKYSDGRCRINSCNKEQYYNCDEKECKKLNDYKIMWDEETESCVRKDMEVMKCSQFDCPRGYSNVNEDFECKKKLSREEIERKLDGRELDEGDVTGYLDMCDRKVCCKKNYTCEQYYAPPETDISDCNCENGSCVDKCYYGDKLYSYEYYDPSDDKYKTIYYPYKEVKEEGKTYNDNDNDNECNSPDSCSAGECFTENKCNCENGTSVTRDKCTINGANICERCDDGYNLNNGDCVGKRPRPPSSPQTIPTYESPKEKCRKSIIGSDGRRIGYTESTILCGSIYLGDSDKCENYYSENFDGSFTKCEHDPKGWLFDCRDSGKKCYMK